MAGLIKDIGWDNPSDELYRAALSAIQSISSIRKARHARRPADDNSRGARVQRLESSIATLDNTQSKAVIETVDGVQRIRGLAGSGKTIVLALKAAYLHSQHPEWNIAVTFSTRSLRGYFRRLITSFSIEQAGEEPDWSRLQVLVAWGAAGGEERDGIYHQFCVQNSIEYQDFTSGRANYGTQDALGGVCRAALGTVTEPAELYDAILVDEAQDLAPSFLRLCYVSLTREKRLVYAYDELQTLSGAGVPNADEIFGRDPRGRSLVDFDPQPTDFGARRDIILDVCYRNSRPVLTTAHSLGFGIYRNPEPRTGTGLVQMFDQPGLWSDIGYVRTEGEFKAGQPVVLARTSESSPPFLENHSTPDDLISFHCFRSDAQQADWIADQIYLNVTTDELRYDDIVIINPDPFTTRGNLGPVRKALYERGIMSHVAGVDVDANIFFRTDTDSITCTGIYRAKGNEAAMVYIINAEESVESERSLATIRNRLFTAITRSKAWVRVLGVGPLMEQLQEESSRVRDAHFALDFLYPTSKQLEALRIVHRDMTREEARVVGSRASDLDKLVSDLRNGRVFREDLDSGLLHELRAILADPDD